MLFLPRLRLKTQVKKLSQQLKIRVKWGRFSSKQLDNSLVFVRYDIHLEHNHNLYTTFH